MVGKYKPLNPYYRYFPTAGGNGHGDTCPGNICLSTMLIPLELLMFIDQLAKASPSTEQKMNIIRLIQEKAFWSQVRDKK